MRRARTAPKRIHRQAFRPKGSLTVAEVAKELGLHPATVRRAIRSGSLEATLGSSRVYYITREALDAFLDRFDVVNQGKVRADEG